MLKPFPNETQPKFAIRFHDSLMQQIPDTEARNRACFAAWRESRPDDELTQLADEDFPETTYPRRTDVPLFAEHSTSREVVGPDGQKRKQRVVYDRSALAAITDRCNFRIRDSRDFSPITAGHTPSEPGAPMPDVLGYAGNFRLGMIGRVKPRWAIFGDEYHEDAAALKKLRRRSPEVWVEEKMEDRFMDPIAALGAETPRLDLGPVRYARNTQGQLVERYSSAAAFPRSGSVSIPTHKYESQGRNMEIEQIVNALMQTEPMQWVMQQMQGSQGSGGLTPATPAPAPEAPTGADPYGAACGPKPYMATPQQQQYQAGASGAAETIGGMNINGPGGAQLPDGVSRYSRAEADEYRARERQLRAENAELAERIAALETKNMATEKYSRLQSLRTDYAFDLKEELEYVDPMSMDEFTRHETAIKRNYSRISHGTPQLYQESDIDLEQSHPEQAKYGRKRATKEDIAEVHKYMKSEGCAYEVALDHVMAATA